MVKVKVKSNTKCDINQYAHNMNICKMCDFPKYTECTLKFMYRSVFLIIECTVLFKSKFNKEIMSKKCYLYSIKSFQNNTAEHIF